MIVSLKKKVKFVKLNKNCLQNLEKLTFTKWLAKEKFLTDFHGKF